MDINSLVRDLRPQLQGMGIAFLTSLTALLCSSLVTLNNFLFNTGWAKYQLIGCLEDYLDNIYKPTVEGDTRLDKAVNRMVDQQQEFLTRFHEKVGQILEDSFGRSANQIAEECSRIHKLAEQVYTQFAQSAGTIATGATTFQHSARLLEQQTQSVSKLVPQLQSSAEQFSSGTISFLSAAEKIEQSNLIAQLDRITTTLCTTQQAFTQSTEVLEKSLPDITNGNLRAAQLAEKIYIHFQSFAAQIQEGSEIFQKAAVSIQDSTLAEQLDLTVRNWMLAQQEFTDATLVFSETSQALTPVISSLDASSKVLGDVGSKSLKLNQAILKLNQSNRQNIASREAAFLATQQGFENKMQDLNHLIEKFETNLQTLDKNWTYSAERQLSAHKEQNARLLQILENYTNQISEHQQVLNKLTNLISETQINLQNLGKVWATSSSNQLSDYKQQTERLLLTIEQRAVQIENHQQTLYKLIETLSRDPLMLAHKTAETLHNEVTDPMLSLFLE